MERRDCLLQVNEKKKKAWHRGEERIDRRKKEMGCWFTPVERGGGGGGRTIRDIFEQKNRDSIVTIPKGCLRKEKGPEKKRIKQYPTPWMGKGGGVLTNALASRNLGTGMNPFWSRERRKGERRKKRLARTWGGGQKKKSPLKSGRKRNPG